MLVATGGANAVVQQEIHGTYNVTGQQHGKPCYEKDCAGTVSIYFWDERDGPDNHGWWLVTGEMRGRVCATHAVIYAITPPSNGWKFKDLHLDESDFALLVQPVVTPRPASLCCYMEHGGEACGEKKPCNEDPCGRGMCKKHCRMFGTDCVRHNSAWQEAQNMKDRAERATRRRGGRGTRSWDGPYNR